MLQGTNTNVYRGLYNRNSADTCIVTFDNVDDELSSVPVNMRVFFWCSMARVPIQDAATLSTSKVMLKSKTINAYLQTKSSMHGLGIFRPDSALQEQG